MSQGKIITINKTPELKHTSWTKTNATQGTPFENCWDYYDHPSGNFRAEIWDCTEGAWYHEHPKTEFCCIVEGAVKIQEKDGPLYEYKAGESFIVPKGTPVTWIVEKYAKKLFVGAQNSEKGETVQ